GCRANLEGRVIRSIPVGRQIGIGGRWLGNRYSWVSAGEGRTHPADDAREFIADDDAEQVALTRLDFTVAISRFHYGRGAERQRGVGHDEHDVVEKNVRVEDT